MVNGVLGRPRRLALVTPTGESRRLRKTAASVEKRIDFRAVTLGAESVSCDPAGGILGVVMGAGGGADPGSGVGRRWDVALSFAGAQRDYVAHVAGALKARGVRCFGIALNIHHLPP